MNRQQQLYIKKELETLFKLRQMISKLSKEMQDDYVKGLNYIFPYTNKMLNIVKVMNTKPTCEYCNKEYKKCMCLNNID